MRVNLWRQWFRNLSLAFSRKSGITNPRGRRQRSQAQRSSAARALARQPFEPFAPTFERLEDRLLLAGTVELGSEAAFDYDSLPVDSTICGMSNDGNFILFETSAANVIAGQVDTNNTNDVFLLDRSTGEVKLVSHTGDGLTTGNSSSIDAKISADGSTIVFESSAWNLVTGSDGILSWDVFVYDVGTGEIALVSHAAGSDTTSGNSPSQNATISADGSRIVFESSAWNLVTGIDDGYLDVFVYDVGTGEIALVSHAAGSDTASGNGSSLNATISADGSRIVFESYASNLVTGSDSGWLDVFAYDVGTGEISLVSHAAGSTTTTGDFASQNATISANGSQIVFESGASNLMAESDTNSNWDVFAYDVGTGEITLVSHTADSDTTTGNNGSQNATISADGSRIVFKSSASNLVTGSDAGYWDVFVYDVGTSEIALVSHAAGSETTSGSSESQNATISADGSRIVFESYASNLVTGSDAGYLDVFVYDVGTGEIALVSHTDDSDTTSGNYTSQNATISADGSRIIFESYASNLDGGAITPVGIRQIYVSESETVSLVTQDQGLPSETASGASSSVSVSEDGRFVVFTSSAANLIAGQADTNGASDVFLLDHSTGKITLVSHAVGSDTTTGNQGSQNATISANGSRIVFESYAWNLITGSDAGYLDVFVYDVGTGEIALVSHTADSDTTSGNYTYQNATISADGSRIVFESYASNLVTGSDSGWLDVFAYDVGTGEIALVSHAVDSDTTTGNNHSQNATISADGSRIVFESYASNLVTGSDGGNWDVFAYDVGAGEITLVSHTADSDTTGGNNGSQNATISADGSRIVFESYASNLVTGSDGSNWDVFVYDVGTGEIALVSHAVDSDTTTGNSHSLNATISADGSRIVFESSASNLATGSDGGYWDVFAYDVGTGEITLVSHTADSDTTSGNGISLNATISADGSRIVFESYASNLVTGSDIYGTWDVFVYDVGTDEIALVSHTADSDSTAGNGTSENATISADGSLIVFESSASNLVLENDFNSQTDIFLSLVNFSPTAADDEFTTNEDTPITPATGRLLSNDEDADGDTLTLTEINGTAVTDGQEINLTHGMLTIHADGTFSYVFDKAADNLRIGDDSDRVETFSYMVSDGHGGTDTAIVTITITPTNDAPVATANGFIADEDAASTTGATGDLLANDDDPDGDDLTVTAVNGTLLDGQPITLTYGTLTINPDGMFSYVFDKNIHNLAIGDYNLTETFSYTVSDGRDGFDTATVAITISSTNDDPVAVNDDFTSVEVLEDDGDVVVGNVLGNDTDPDIYPAPDTLIVESQTDTVGTAGGLFSVDTNGDVTFDPNGAFEDLAAGEFRQTSFTYTMSDGLVEKTATATITVTGQNDDPTANADTLTTNEETASGGALLTNDSDPDAGETAQLLVASVNGQPANVGQEITLTSGAKLTVNVDGTYTYNPNGAFNHLAAGSDGTDSFTYTVKDPQNVTSESATVTITITGVNDTPVATSDTAATDELKTTTGNLLSNDSDPNGDPLTVTQINGQAVTSGQTVTLASGAKLTINANGSYSYNPNGAFNSLAENQTAADTFTYTVSDGHGGTATASATITVTGLDPRGDVTINPKAIASGKSNIKLNFTGGDAVDLQIVFTDAGIQLIGQNGTTINGLAMLTLDGVDNLRGKFGDGDDKITIVGDATKARIDLGAGNNTVVFDGFTSDKQTSVSAKGGSLDFTAIDSTFGKLLVTGGNLDDMLTFLNVRVDNGTTLRLLDGMDNITIHDSTFDGHFSVSSSGDGAAFNVETGAANGAMTQFLGKFKYATGGNPAVTLAPLNDSDDVTFGKGSAFFAKSPSGTLDAGSQVNFGNGPKLKNITRV